MADESNLRLAAKVASSIAGAFEGLYQHASCIRDLDDISIRHGNPGLAPGLERIVASCRQLLVEMDAVMVPVATAAVTRTTKPREGSA